MTPGYLRQKPAAAYLGMKERWFRDNCPVPPKTLPGNGTKPVLVWRVAELDAWVESCADPKSRKRRRAS